MRIPVFARGSDPAKNRPNVRKSISYCTEEIEAGRADWVNPADPSKGILCRAFLYSGQQLMQAAPESLAKLARPRRCPLAPLELGFTRFDDPEKTSTKRRERRQLVVTASAIAYFDMPLELVQQL